MKSKATIIITLVLFVLSISCYSLRRIDVQNFHEIREKDSKISGVILEQGEKIVFYKKDKISTTENTVIRDTGVVSFSKDNIYQVVRDKDTDSVTLIVKGNKRYKGIILEETPDSIKCYCSESYSIDEIKFLLIKKINSINTLLLFGGVVGALAICISLISVDLFSGFSIRL